MAHLSVAWMLFALGLPVAIAADGALDADVRIVVDRSGSFSDALADSRRNARICQELGIMALEAAVTNSRDKVAKLETRPQPAEEVVAMAPPSIQIIDPPLGITRDTATADVHPGLTKRKVVGRVTAPAGLLSFAANDVLQEVDADGYFMTYVELAAQKTRVTMVAVDRQGKRTALDLFLQVDAPVAQCRSVPPTLRELMRDRASCAGGTLVFGWREQGELQGASAFVRQIEMLSKARSVFECEGSTCFAVVPTANPDHKETTVRTLSVCEVTAIGTVYGPPTHCRPVVMKGPSTTLVMGVTGQLSGLACAMGARDFDAVFKDRRADVGDIVILVAEALKNKPFNLTVMQEGDDVLGTRAHLPSEVFSGWREWVTVRVGLRARGNDIGASIATSILVSRQNSTDREAWTPPSEQQESAYVEALRAAFVKRGGVLGQGRMR